MTCFWRGLISAISKPELQKILGIRGGIHEFIKELKENVRPTPISVMWNDTQLSEKQIDENIKHIKSYDLKQAHTGYWCSCCDPFLLLICDLFNANIHHKYISIQLFTHS